MDDLSQKTQQKSKITSLVCYFPYASVVIITAIPKTESVNVGLCEDRN